MKHRLIALLLTVVLTAGLGGCTGGTTPQGTVEPTPDTTEAITLAPDTTPDPDPGVTAIPDKGTPPPDTTHHPDDHTGDDPAHHTPEVTHHPDDDHQTPAVDPTPTPTPEPTPEPSAVSAKEVYDAVSAVAGSANLSDMSVVMAQFYNVSTSDLEDFVFYMPDMSANIEEIFIAHAKSGKVSSVKAACQSRLDGLREEGEFYPDTGKYLDGAKLETSGDWVILAVCEKASSAVKAFQDALK